MSVRINLKDGFLNVDLTEIIAYRYPVIFRAFEYDIDVDMPRFSVYDVETLFHVHMLEKISEHRNVGKLSDAATELGNTAISQIITSHYNRIMTVRCSIDRILKEELDLNDIYTLYGAGHGLCGDDYFWKELINAKYPNSTLEELDYEQQYLRLETLNGIYKTGPLDCTDIETIIDNISNVSDTATANEFIKFAIVERGVNPHSILEKLLKFYHVDKSLVDTVFDYIKNKDFSILHPILIEKWGYIRNDVADVISKRTKLMERNFHLL